MIVLKRALKLKMESSRGKEGELKKKAQDGELKRGSSRGRTQKGGFLDTKV